MRVAIIGAGLSGLTAGFYLSQNKNIEVQIFEKARGVGGRLSTRYADSFQFDHGCQDFNITSNDFLNFIEEQDPDLLYEWWPKTVLVQDKHTQPLPLDWDTPHYIYSPKMNSLCKALAEKQNVIFLNQISKIYRDKSWSITSKDGKNLGDFDCIIFSIPYPQAVEIAQNHSNLLQAVQKPIFNPKHVVMLGLNQTLNIDWEVGIIAQDPIIKWIIQNHLKPGRDLTAPCLTIQTQTSWSHEHINQDKESLIPQVLQHLEQYLDLAEEMIAYSSIHAWKYAKIQQPIASAPTFLLDSSTQIGFCGDWLADGTVQGAYLSGKELALSLTELQSQHAN